jgi:hypothetical protein
LVWWDLHDKKLIGLSFLALRNLTPPGKNALGVSAIAIVKHSVADLVTNQPRAEDAGEHGISLLETIGGWPLLNSEVDRMGERVEEFATAYGNSTSEICAVAGQTRQHGFAPSADHIQVQVIVPGSFCCVDVTFKASPGDERICYRQQTFTVSKVVGTVGKPLLYFVWQIRLARYGRNKQNHTNWNDRDGGKLKSRV